MKDHISVLVKFKIYSLLFLIKKGSIVNAKMRNALAFALLPHPEFSVALSESPVVGSLLFNVSSGLLVLSGSFSSFGIASV